MIIINLLEIFASNTYLGYVFWLAIIGGWIYQLVWR